MKKIFIIAIVSGKSVKIFIGLKMTRLGVLDSRERDKYNERDLKEGGVIEMSTTVLHSRAAPLLEYLPLNKCFRIKIISRSCVSIYEKLVGNRKREKKVCFFFTAS